MQRIQNLEAAYPYQINLDICAWVEINRQPPKRIGNVPFDFVFVVYYKHSNHCMHNLNIIANIL